MSAWPDVEIDKHYRVNKSASGNSAAREDEVGVCVEKRESPFGHKWATLAFADGSREAVRTVLLEQVQGPLEQETEA